jgi:hypothetical protein
MLEKERRTASIGNGILQADIKSCIGERCESLTSLADNVLGTPIIIAHGIFDLSPPPPPK